MLFMYLCALAHWKPVFVVLKQQKQKTAALFCCCLS